MQFNSLRLKLLALSIMLLASDPGLLEGLGLPANTAWGAKKYYPPDFTLPGEAPTNTETVHPPQETPPVATPVETPDATGVGKRVKIIKLVPTVKYYEKPVDKLTALIDEKRFYEALHLVNQRIKKTPGNGALYLTKAEILSEDKNYEQSTAEFRKVLTKIKKGPLRVRAFTGLGRTQLKQALHIQQTAAEKDLVDGLYKQAGASFRQALKLSPHYPDAWIGLAKIALAQGNMEEAQADLQRVKVSSSLDHSKTALELSLAHGKLDLLQGRTASAFTIASAAKQKFPDEPGAYLLLGQACLAMDRYDDAIIQFRKVLDRHPESTETLKLLSSAYERKTNVKDAESALQKAVNLNPSDLSAARSLIKLYEQQNDRERAILLIKSLLQTDSKLSQTNNIGDQTLRLSYQRELMELLHHEHRWEELYELGKTVISTYVPDETNGSSLENLDIDAAVAPKSGERTQSTGNTGIEPQIDREVSLFIQAAHVLGKGQIDRPAFATLPINQKVLAYCQRNLQRNPSNPEPVLYLLMLNPLTQVPEASGSSAKSEVGKNELNDLSVQLKIAYLQGDQSEHQRLINALNQAALPPKELLALAEEMLILGDLNAAKQLSAELAPSPDTVGEFEIARQALRTQMLQLEQKSEEQLKVLRLLPKAIPDSYWDKTAEEALRLSSGNAKTHGLLAEGLLARKRPALALIQQRLAAQYATSPKEKAYWEKKARKTEDSLNNTSRFKRKAPPQPGSV